MHGLRSPYRPRSRGAPTFLGAIRGTDQNAMTETNESKQVRVSPASRSQPHPRDLPVHRRQPLPWNRRGDPGRVDDGAHQARTRSVPRGLLLSTDARSRRLTWPRPPCATTVGSWRRAPICVRTKRLVPGPGTLPPGLFLVAIADDAARQRDKRDHNCVRRRAPSRSPAPPWTPRSRPHGRCHGRGRGTIMVSLTTANMGNTGSGAFGVGIYFRPTRPSPRGRVFRHQRDYRLASPGGDVPHVQRTGSQCRFAPRGVLRRRDRG